MAASSHSFRMTDTDKNFTWCEEKYESLPIIRCHDGTISQALMFYFGYLARTRAEAVSSMYTRAYTLREWAEFLWQQGLDLRDGGNDAMMHRYAQAQRESDAEIEESQIAVKVRRIYEFYLHLPDALRFWEDGTPVGEFVGEPHERRPITTLTYTVKGKTYTRWSGQGRIKQNPPHPSVLDDDEVQAVCTAARTLKASKHLLPTGQIDYSATQILIPDRNWLLANCMARGGLRAAETCALTCRSITDALRLENLLKSVEAKYGRIASVADLSDRPDAQEILLSSLKAFEHKKRRMFIYVDIIGKGSKRRKAAFPIDLIKDLLIVGIWMVRRFQIANHCSAMSAVPPDTVFLSFKTGIDMLPGSVADIMKAAFVAAGVNGSGHDLRKYYATNTANRILKRTLDDLGYLTQAVLNTVYDQVASALGHANVNTTTKHYVNVAMVNYTGLETRRQRRKILQIWEALIAQQDRLDPERIRLCGTAILSIAKAPKESDLYGILQGVLTDPSINPDGMIKFAHPKPNLKLVVSNRD